jgi:hypothetical protein
MKKFGINCQLRKKLFLIVIHRFSVVKAAMNAPCISKLLQQCEQNAKLPKAEQRPLRTCQLRRDRVFEA